MGVICNSVVVCGAVVLVIWAWKVLNWVWLRPKKLEKCLRQQGLKGNDYRLLFGDMKEMSMMFKQAQSKSINISDNIVPHVSPFVHESVRKYGKYFIIWFGGTPRVHIMEPELIKDVLTKYYNFQKPKSNPLIKLLASGIASYDGEEWVRRRKIINPAFHVEKLKNMLPAFDLSCSEMVNKWKKLASAKGSCELDVWPYLQTLTSDAISRTAFGSSYEEGRRIFRLQKEQTEHAIQVVMSVYFPGLRFLPTKRNRRMKEINKEVNFSLKSIIDKRLKKMHAGKESYDDLLGILLESNLKEIKQHGNTSHGMSIEDVIQECKLFYFAGQETTSTLLVWTMVFLSQYPHWQSRAREEIFQVFGNKKPDFDGLNHLKVVTMILYEVLRLYPPIDTLIRRVHKDTALGELFLPCGVEIGFPISLLHRDQEIWGDDANDFKPERFSEGVSKATKNKVSFFPFGWGPRICIGQNFAMLEAKMALAMILQCFFFDLSASYVHAPFPVITLQPQYGAHLTLRKV